MLPIRKRYLVFLLTSLSACHSITGGHHVVSPSALAPSPMHPTLLTSGERGVFLVSENGEALRRTDTPASQARRRADGTIFFLHNSGPLMELRSLTKDTERVVASVPVNWEVDPSSCTAHAAPSGVTLAVQDETGFFINPSGTHACLSLMDRNLNMLDLAVRASIDLATGAVTSRLQYFEDCVVHETDAKDVCAHVPAIRRSTAVSGTNGARKWQFRNGRLHTHESSNNPIELCGQTSIADASCGVDSTSPSGRWIAITLGTEDGDYIHRSIVLADLDTGEIVALDQDGGLQIGHQLPSCLAMNSCVDIVGETPVHWFPGSDQFSIDDKLIDLRTKQLRKLPGIPSP